MIVTFRHDQEAAVALQGLAGRGGGHCQPPRQSTGINGHLLAVGACGSEPVGACGSKAGLSEKIPGVTRESGCLRLTMDSVTGKQQTESLQLCFPSPVYEELSMRPQEPSLGQDTSGS